MGFFVLPYSLPLLPSPHIHHPFAIHHCHITSSNSFKSSCLWPFIYSSVFDIQSFCNFFLPFALFCFCIHYTSSYWVPITYIHLFAKMSSSSIHNSSLPHTHSIWGAILPFCLFCLPSINYDAFITHYHHNVPMCLCTYCCILIQAVTLHSFMWVGKNRPMVRVASQAPGGKRIHHQTTFPAILAIVPHRHISLCFWFCGHINHYFHSTLIEISFCPFISGPCAHYDYYITLLFCFFDHGQIHFAISFFAFVGHHIPLPI